MSASTLLDGMSGLFTPDVLGKAASLLGESDTAVRKGVSATVPALLGGVASHVDEPGFASSLFALVKSPANDGSVLNNVGSLFSANSTAPIMGLGNKLLGSVFGGETSNFTRSLAGFAGMKSSSAMSLLNFAAPLVLAFLGKQARKDNLNASSLATLLRNEKDTIEAAVPAPLAHLESPPAMPAMDAPMHSEMYRPQEAERSLSPMRWVIPIVGALIAMGLLIWVFGRDDGSPSPAQSAVGIAAETPHGSVYFDIDQSALPSSAQTELAAVVAYMNQNPSAKAVVTGFHDPAGGPIVSEEIARNRAEAVRTALQTAGIPDSRIEVPRPVATEGAGVLEQARRIEVTVR